MPWFKVDDNLAFHHKVVAAGNPALGLWVRAGSLCAQQLTDGFVPDHMIPTLGTIAQAKRLVTVGLWDRVKGGYRFHGWDERQPSKASVEAERAAAQERMRAYRAKKKGTAPKESSQVSEPRSPEQNPNEHGTNSEVQRSFANPDPSLSQSQSQPDPSMYGGEPPSAGRALAIVGDISASPTAQSLVGEWIDHCDSKPPKQVVGQVAKHLKAMLDEGIEPTRIRAALAEWNRKGLHPSTLPSVVHEIGNRRPAQRKNDIDWDVALERARQIDANGGIA